MRDGSARAGPAGGSSRSVPQRRLGRGKRICGRKKSAPGAIAKQALNLPGSQAGIECLSTGDHAELAPKDLRAAAVDQSFLGSIH